MISSDKKTELIKTYARTEGDTGSPEVQIAVLTERITELTDHMKKNPQGLSFQQRPSEDGW
jgi:small subunit ribosomal protein S15